MMVSYIHLESIENYWFRFLSFLSLFQIYFKSLYIANRLLPNKNLDGGYSIDIPTEIFQFNNSPGK